MIINVSQERTYTHIDYTYWYTHIDRNLGKSTERTYVGFLPFPHQASISIVQSSIVVPLCQMGDPSTTCPSASNFSGINTEKSSDLRPFVADNQRSPMINQSGSPETGVSPATFDVVTS